MKKIYDLNKIIQDENLYNEIWKNSIDDFLQDYNKYKDSDITININGKKENMYYANFISNLIFVKPLLTFKLPLNEGFIWREEKWENISKKDIPDFLNFVYKYLSDKNISTIKICNALAEILEGIENISKYFAMFEGVTLSIIDKFKLSKKCPEYLDLLHTTIPEDMDANDAEKYLSDRTDQLLNIFKTYDNDLQIPAIMETGLNKDQVQQMEIAIGNVSNIDGKILPIRINTNFLLGLKKRSEYYGESLKGKHAGIINHTAVEDAGYFNRKLNLLCMNTMLFQKPDDCGTKGTYNVYIDSIETLERYDGRYYYKEKSNNRRSNKHIGKIDGKNIKLLGKTFKVYTPIKCVHSSGYVCDKCYGAYAKMNRHKHIGIAGVLNLTEKITQKMLSSKHILKTISEKLNWNKKIMTLFNFNLSEIFIKEKFTKKNYSLIIYKDDIDEDRSIEGRIFTNIFYFKNEQGEEKKIEAAKLLRVNDELDLSETANAYILKLKNFDITNSVFWFDIENNQLTKPLRDLDSLIVSAKHLDMTTIDEFMAKFIQLLNIAKIDLMAVDAEIILRNLVRSLDDISKRPNFDTIDEASVPYVIPALKEAQKHTDNIIGRLIFEDLKKLLLQSDTYNTNGIYLLDPLFLNSRDIV